MCDSEKSEYTTKLTAMRGFWWCQIQRRGKPVVQAKAFKRDEIGPTFRSILRTLDKLGGDRFTSAARERLNDVRNKEFSYVDRNVQLEWL